MKIMNAVNSGMKNFCKTLGFKLERGSKLGKNVYGVSIPLTKGEKTYYFYLYFKKDFLKRVAMRFFKEFNENDLTDLSREVANQVIGHTKNILEKNEPGYKLGLPEFLGKVERFPIKFDNSKIYKIKNRTFKIGYTIDG